MKYLRLLALCFLGILSPISGTGQTVHTWNGGNGLWSTDTLWTPTGIPNSSGLYVLIDGGKLVDSTVTLDMNATVGGLTIDAGDVLAIGDASFLTLANATVSNAGSLSLASAGSGATVYIDGSVTFQGLGKITLGNEVSNLIRYWSAPGTDSLLNKQTIEGRGGIDVLLNNQGGVIHANFSSQTLNLYQATTNTGTLQASNGATLSLESIEVGNTGGLIQAQADSTVRLNNSVITGGTLTNTGGTLMSGSNTRLHGAGAGITINGAYTIGDGSATILTGAVINNGVIGVNSAGLGATLYLDGSVQLTGTGKISMTAGANNLVRYYSSPETDTLTNSQLIEGAGVIDVNLTHQAGALIHANITGQRLTLYRQTTNLGTMRASGGGALGFYTATVTNTGSTIEALAGSAIELAQATITGGTVRTVGAAEIELASGSITGGMLANSASGIIRAVSGNSTIGGLDNVAGGRVIVGDGAALTLKGTLQNDGSIELTSLGLGATLYADGAVTMAGGGTVTMSGISTQIRYYANPSTDTLVSHQNIAGRGSIDVLFTNSAGREVNANATGETLFIHQQTTNAGTLRASNGGVLSLQNIPLANAGGTIDALAGATVCLNNSVIAGGTLSNTGGSIFSGSNTRLIGPMTVAGTYTIGDGASTVVEGMLTNNGTIALDSAGLGATWYIDGVVDLKGTGGITLNNAINNLIRYYGSPENDLLNNEQTIAGRGMLDININHKAGELIDANVGGQTLNILRAITNNGTVQASGGGTLTITSTTISNVGGMIQALSGSTVSLTAGTRIDGGTLKNDGGTITFGSNLTLDGTHAAGITILGRIAAPNATDIQLLNKIHNGGTIALDSTGGLDTTVSIGGNGTGVVTLDGNGTVSLGEIGSGSVVTATMIGNRLVNQDNVIEGAGDIGNGSMRLTNRGTIQAHRLGQSLSINLDAAAGSGINSGTLRATNGGQLLIGSAIANFEGATSGVVEAAAESLVTVANAAAAGGVVRTVGTGQIDLANGSITGGTLLNSSTGLIRAVSGLSTINGLTNSAGGQVRLENATGLALQGVVQNEGTIALQGSGGGATLYIEGAVTLQGSGKVTMNDEGFNSIRHRAVLEDDILHNEQTIEGRGEIDVILANTSAALINANIGGATIEVRRATTNAGVMQASNGGRLEISSLLTNNVAGTIQALTLSTLAFSNNPTIAGGIVRNLGGPVDFQSNVTFDGSHAAGITLEGTFTAPDYREIHLVNAVYNTGSIALASTEGTPALVVKGNGTGTATLLGNGMITLGGTGSYAAITATTLGNRLVNENNTIQGKGSIGQAQMMLTNRSLISANVSGLMLEMALAPGAGSAVNTGTIRASNGGTLRLSGSTMGNAGGFMEAQSASLLEVHAAAIDGGTVRTLGTGEVRLLSGEILNGMLSNNALGIIRAAQGVSRINALNNAAGGQVVVDNGASLILQGSLTNSGDMRLNSSDSGSYLRIDGTVQLLGGGKVILGAGDYNEIRYADAPATDTLISQQTIEGRGDISVLLNNAAGRQVDANVSGQVLSLNGNVTNAGTLRASGGGVLSLNSITVANPGAMIAALPNSTVNLNNSLIVGGTLSNTGIGIFSGAATFLDGSGVGGIDLQGTYIIDNGRATALRGNVNNANLIDLTSGASGAYLFIDGNVNLNGAGTVRLGSGEYNEIRYNLASATDRLTNHQTIEGRGAVNVRMTNTDDGVVNANVAGTTLSLGGDSFNTGVWRASNGATLSLVSIIVANAGGLIQALADSFVQLNNSTIVGGVLHNAGLGMLSGNATYLDGSFDGTVTLLGPYTIGNGKATAVNGTINNNELISLNSAGSGAYLTIDGTVNLLGNGRVTLGDSDYNAINFHSNAGSDLLNNQQRIEGRGTINVRTHNQPTGLIVANIAGQSLTMSQPVTNSGILRAGTSGKLVLSGGGSSTGPIEMAPGAEVDFTGGDFVLDQGSDISGAGVARLSGGVVHVGDSASDTVAATNVLIANGELSGPGSMIVSNGFTWVEGNVSGSGALHIPLGATGAFSGFGGNLSQRTITNHGTLIWTKDFLTASNGAAINNTGTMHLQGSPAFNGMGVSTINNSGAVVKSAAGTAVLNTAFTNTGTGTVTVQTGVLEINGSSSSSGGYALAASTVVEFGSGVHEFNAGASVSGAGKMRISENSQMSMNSSNNLNHLHLRGGTILGSGNVNVETSFQWSGGTLGGGGDVTVDDAAIMQIESAASKFLDGRNLINNGIANWSDGAMTATGGARFINNGTLGVTGDATFSSGAGVEAFVNYGRLVVPDVGSLIINGDFSNHGTVQQGVDPGAALMRDGIGAANHGNATVTVNGKIRHKGTWTLWDHILHWTFGTVPLELENQLTTSGSSGGANITSSAPVTVSGSLIATNNAAIVANGGGNIIANGGGNIIANGGGNIVANGGGNIIANGGGNIIANGGGNITNLGGRIEAINGGGLRSDGPGALISTASGDVVANGGGHIVGSNAGAIIANGGGNVINGNGSTMTADGGSIGSAGGSVISGNGSTATAINGGSIFAGASVISGNGSTVISGNGGTVISGNGSTDVGGAGAGRPTLLSKDGVTASAFTGPMILAQDGGNLVGMTGGLFIGNMVAEAGGSVVPGGVGTAATMTVQGGGLDLQADSLLKVDLLGLTKGVTYDFLSVGGQVFLNGDLLLSIAFNLRTIESAQSFTILTALEPVVGTIGNLDDDRVFTIDGFGSFRVTYGTDNNVVLDDFEATALTYELWTTAWNFADELKDDFAVDADLDGMVNGLEYALGMDPLTADIELSAQVLVVQVAGVNYLALSFVRQAGVNTPTDVSYDVQRSNNLSNPGGGWSSAGLIQHSADPGPEAGFETIVVRSTTPVGAIGNTVEFLRLKIIKLD